MSSSKSDREVTLQEPQAETPIVPVAIQIRRLEKLETTNFSQGASN